MFVLKTQSFNICDFKIYSFKCLSSKLFIKQFCEILHSCHIHYFKLLKIGWIFNRELFTKLKNSFSKLFTQNFNGAWIFLHKNPFRFHIFCDKLFLSAFVFKVWEKQCNKFCHPERNPLFLSSTPAKLEINSMASGQTAESH